MIYRKLRKHIYQSTQAGYTLVESMVAMVLVSILAASIAPMLGFWVASRVQARRVELAAVAARTYIDGVRSEVIAHPAYYTTDPNNISEIDVSGLECDNGNSYCAQPSLTNEGEFFCINNDDEVGCQDSSATDIVLHVGSYNNCCEGSRGRFYLDSDDKPLPAGQANYDIGYRLDVRVYQARAFSEGGELLRSNSTEKKTAGVSGLAKKKAPLLEISTEITTGETNYFELENLLGN